MADPYGMDFLQRIVAVNFASGGYVTITVTSTASVQGSSNPPAFPTISISLGKNEKLVDSKVLSQTTTSVPPHTVTSPIVNTLVAILPWLSALPVPTLANWTLSNGLVAYGTQFAELIDVNNSGFLKPSQFGITNVPVNFVVQSQIDAYIASFNARFATGGPNFITNYFPLPGATGDILAAPVLFSTKIIQTTGGQTTTVPGSASATTVQEFLVQVPSDQTSITVTASAPGGTNVNGYHGTTPTSISKVTGTPDSTASAGSSCVVTSQITKNVNTVTAS